MTNEARKQIDDTEESVGFSRTTNQVGRHLLSMRRGSDPYESISALRICRFEDLEERKYLAADVHLGAVYFEDATGDDFQGDTIQITFEGGEPGTELTHVVIDGDKQGDGPSAGDIFFDTASGGHGAFGSSPLKIIASDGFQVLNFNVTDGGSRITFDLAGFKAGMKLVFTVDTDEIQFIDSSTGTRDVNAIVEGGEFQRSKLEGSFNAPHFQNVTAHALFWDAYDDEFAEEQTKTGSHLNLPSDRYSDSTDFVDRTAGAVASAKQIPLPITLAGTVFDDWNLSNTQQPGEPGIAGVSLSLLVWNGSSYVPTGKTVVTNAVGDYQFDGLLPGKYRVVESQPSGYFSVGATAGKVDGSIRGVVESSDVLGEIALLGGDDSVDNDFAEARPNSVSGRVHVDNDGDCTFTPGDVPLAGVTIQLRDATGAVIRTTTTDVNGMYHFDNLIAGVYTIFEVQPVGHVDGGEDVGTAGGTITANDTISGIQLVGGTIGEHYDFCEKLPASIRGYVHADVDGDCVFDPEERPIAGVVIHLLDAGGSILQVTTTDSNGQYAFENLTPGEYQIRELQPAGYFDSGDHPGSEGGVVLENDLISQILLKPGRNGEEYHFCEIPPAKLSGYVYHDANNNGIRDANEQGIAGVSVALLDSSGNYTGRSEVTDANGRYTFDELRPGTYSVKEVQPAQWLDGLDSAGTAGGTATNPGDRIVGALLKPNQHAAEYNFGELLPASIRGRVHADTDGDCEFDPGEKPIAGVVIALYDSNGTRIATTTTNSEGEYVFSGLKPGTYTVHEIQPAGYFDGGQDAGSAGGIETDDTISQIPLGSGVDAVDYNFCEKPPAMIAGYVFQDGAAISVTNGQSPDVPAVRDGLLTPDDTRLAGVVLELRDGITGEPILGSATLGGKYPPNQIVTVVTDANGYYEFVGLKAGTYAVYQQQDPAGYIDGLNTAGTTGGIVVSAYTQLDQGILDQLAALPASGDALLQIVVGAGQSSTANNFSEVATTPLIIIINPPPTPPPPVYPQSVWMLPQIISPPVFTPPIDVPKFLYGGSTRNYTWHLSVLDAGHPRGDSLAAAERAIQEVSLEEDSFWNSTNLKRSKWSLATRNAEGKLSPPHKVVFGLIDSVPITGDFNGDGTTDVGVFKDGEWFIDINGNGEWDDEDLWAKLGTRDDKPVTGDWNGDGKTDIGIYGPAWARDPHAIKHEPGIPDPANTTRDEQKNHPPLPEDAAIGDRKLQLTAQGKTRADLIDHVFHYGTVEDIPVTGDWNGDGIDTIGIFHGGKWYRDTDGDGRWSPSNKPASFGSTGDKPTPGDWNGDGQDELGIYREGTWYLDTNGNEMLDGGDEVIQLGGPNDQPVVGDWDGDGRDEVGIVRNGEVTHTEKLTGTLRKAM